MKIRETLLILLSLLTACSAIMRRRPVDESIVGTWRLYETGNDSSGGFNYSVKPVSSSPPQTITFQRNGHFYASVNDPLSQSLYSSVRTYSLEKIATDTTTYSLVCQPKKRGKESTFRQGLFLRNDTLRLNPLCVEGCHFAFVRVK